MAGRRLARSGAAFLTLSLLGGCFHAGAFPRSGETLGGGSIGAGARFTIGSYAPGSIDGERGNTAQRATPSPAAILGFGMQLVQGYLTVGLTDRVELEAGVGGNELTLGGRVGLLSEEEGDPMSMALSVTGTIRPMFLGNRSLFDPVGFGVRAAVDLGRDLGDGTVLVASPTISYGPEAHAMAADRAPPCGGFGSEGCGEYGPGPYAYVLRRELRLQLPIGVVLRTEDPDTVDATFGLVPYYTPVVGETLDRDCVGCEESDYDTLVEDFGIHFVAGVTTDG